ncbi:MAG: hypothetical protein ACYTE3_18510 [Planctomycetota bacterium]
MKRKSCHLLFSSSERDILWNSGFFRAGRLQPSFFFAPCHNCLASLQYKIKNQSAKHVLSEVEGCKIKEVIPACRDSTILMFGLSFLILSERTSSRLAGISQYDITH